MTKKRIAVLGAGVAGVMLARELSRDPSISVDLLENSSHLGGLMRSVRFRDAVFDVGAFVFTETHDLFKAFPELKSCFLRAAVRSVVIRSPGSIDSYPISLDGYLRDYGFLALLSLAGDFLVAKIKYRRQEDLSEWLKYYLGDGLYERSGLKKYIERLYCDHIDNIDVEFAHQRLHYIKDHAQLRHAIPAILTRAVKKIRSPESPDAPQEKLVRPEAGFDAVFEIVQKSLEALGVSVLTACEIQKLERLEEGFVIRFPGGARCYERVISTIPVPVAARLAGIPDYGACRYMNLFSLFYRFRGSVRGHWTYLYNFTQDGQWKRISMFSDLYGTRNGEHYFTAEGTCHSAEREESLAAQKLAFEKHLSRLDIMNGSLQYQGGTITECAYPLYSHGNTENIQKFKARLAEWGILYTGRQASFDYLNSANVASRAASLAATLRSNH